MYASFLCVLVILFRVCEGARIIVEVVTLSPPSLSETRFKSLGFVHRLNPWGG